MQFSFIFKGRENYQLLEKITGLILKPLYFGCKVKGTKNLFSRINIYEGKYHGKHQILDLRIKNALPGDTPEKLSLISLIILKFQDSDLSHIETINTPNLKKLVIAGSDLSGLKTFNAPHLQWLVISDSNLDNMSTINAPNLQELVIAGSDLTCLPIIYAPNLQELVIAGSDLSGLPIIYAPQLRRLDLRGTNITSEDLKRDPVFQELLKSLKQTLKVHYTKQGFETFNPPKRTCSSQSLAPASQTRGRTRTLKM